VSTNLPITEGAARPMFAPLETSLAALVEQYNDLKTKPLTIMTVNLAKQLDTDAKTFLSQAEASEARQAIDSAYKVHRFLSGMFKKATDPALEIRRWASGIMAKWEQQRRMEADRQRREREEAARKEQERIRAEEAAALKSAGHKEEAKELLKAPLPPVALPEAKDAPGKVDGVSVIDTWKPDDTDWLIDGAMFYAWMAKHPECHHMMTPKLAPWKAYLTNAKGSIQPDGMRVIKDSTTRNRG